MSEEEYSNRFEIGMIGKIVEIGLYTAVPDQVPGTPWEDRESDDWLATHTGTLVSYTENAEKMTWILAPGTDDIHVGFVTKNEHVIIITWLP